ncbi:hypothetical protein MAR_007977 [Mya arenaria]|uniref:Uncharacterized protein n=1 Tax=Mya arenaria TaxID=6604 RepID=A0ABY7DWJ3_MYAAR|nr:hypothetical protein MAR_007977 [Mya arenaria]
MSIQIICTNYFPVLDHPLQIPVTWPLGNYGLMETSAGCPGARVLWSIGWRHYDTEDSGPSNRFSFSISNYLSDERYDRPWIRFAFRVVSPTTTYEQTFALRLFHQQQHTMDCGQGGHTACSNTETAQMGFLKDPYIGMMRIAVTRTIRAGPYQMARRSIKCGYDSAYGPSVRTYALRREMSGGVRDDCQRPVHPLGR